MLIKFYAFEAGVIAAGILGILGAALLLAVISLARSERPSKESRGKKAPGRSYLKPLLAVGAGLIVLAVLVYPTRQGLSWTGERYLFRDAKAYELELADVPAGPEGLLDLKTMAGSRKLVFSRGEFILRRDGYIETPFRRWPAGRYAFEIDVRGTAWEGRPARLLAAFLGISGRRLAAMAPLREYAAESERKTWTYTFEVDRETVGKVRLHLLNATTETKDVFREVRLARAEVRKIGT